MRPRDPAVRSKPCACHVFSVVTGHVNLRIGIFRHKADPPSAVAKAMADKPADKKVERGVPGLLRRSKASGCEGWTEPFEVDRLTRHVAPWRSHASRVAGKFTTPKAWWPLGRKAADVGGFALPGKKLLRFAEPCRPAGQAGRKPPLDLCPFQRLAKCLL